MTTIPTADVEAFLHEIAQPLAVLDGYLVALGAAALDPAAEEHLAAAQAASRLLMDLVHRFGMEVRDGG